MEIFTFGRSRGRAPQAEASSPHDKKKRGVPRLTPQEIQTQAAFLARIAVDPKRDFIGAVTRTLTSYKDASAPVAEVAETVEKKFEVAPLESKTKTHMDAQILALGDQLPHLFKTDKEAIRLRHVRAVRSALAQEIWRKRHEEKPPERRDMTA